MIANFFHRLFNPHCPDCITEEKIKYNEQLRLEELKTESNRCRSCEMLEMENARLINQNNMLIEKLTTPNTIVEETPSNTTNLKPLMPSRIPFSVVRAELERNDRAKAKIMKEAVQPVKSDITKIEELETQVLNTELDLNNGTSS